MTRHGPDVRGSIPGRVAEKYTRDSIQEQGVFGPKTVGVTGIRENYKMNFSISNLHLTSLRPVSH